MILMRITATILAIVGALLGLVFHEGLEVIAMCAIFFLSGAMLACSYPDMILEMYSKEI